MASMDLAVGMACCILIFLWVQDELSFNTSHKNYDNLYTTIPELNDAKYYANPLARGLFSHDRDAHANHIDSLRYE